MAAVMAGPVARPSPPRSDHAPHRSQDVVAPAAAYRPHADQPHGAAGVLGGEFAAGAGGGGRPYGEDKQPRPMYRAQLPTAVDSRLPPAPSQG